MASLEFGLAKFGQLDQPLAISFTAVPYANKQSIRENAASASSAIIDITLPMPKNINAQNSITYESGQTETTGGLFDMTTGGWGEWFKSGGGLFSAFNDLTGISAFQGKRPMDERDSIFRGADFRSHSYSWVLIPKNHAEAVAVKDIAYGFQTTAYPRKSGMESYSRVIHPPVWHIKGLDGRGSGTSPSMREWTMEPLPSVLTSVNVQTAGAAGPGIYTISGGYPAATKIDVTFKELEPAINDGTGQLLSRSQLRSGATSPEGD